VANTALGLAGSLNTGTFLAVEGAKFVWNNRKPISKLYANPNFYLQNYGSGAPTFRTKEARIWISMIKTVVPNMALKVIDDAIQMHGGIGVSNDTPLANMWAGQRTLRLADGPDAVHRMVVGRHELKGYTMVEETGATFRDG
jgi:alkylation response protein AidB-like acyl-CoA dehydrogenase